MLPFLLFGHSMGALIASYVVTRTPVDGLILSAATNPLGILFKLYNVLLFSLRMIQGEKSFSSIPDRLTFKEWDKQFPGDKENRWVTSDEEMFALYENDPLCGFPISVKIWSDYKRLMDTAYLQADHWANVKINVWLIAGDQDACAGFHGASSQHLAGLIEKATGRRPTVTIYGNGCRHELLHEKKETRQQVEQDILSWATMVVEGRRAKL